MQLNFKTYGKGPALIILHGLFGSLDNWVSHAMRLAEYFSVYLLDQRNHGKSPHSPIWNYPVMAADLAEFMDQQGIFQAHLLGHSMGGKTVMQFAMDHPERIDRLIVADMAPKAYQPHHTALLEALMQLDLHQFETRSEANQALTPQIPDATVRQFLLKNLSRGSDKSYQWKFNLPVIYHNYPAILEAIELEYPLERPTLFISGAKSDYVQAADYPIIREGFPQAQFSSIEGAGHWLHAEAPDEFFERVLAFLQNESL